MEQGRRTQGRLPDKNAASRTRGVLLRTDMSSADAPASELELSQKWDRAVENSLRKTGNGALIAVLPSLILFRRAIPRFAGIAFGAGFGAGMSYVEAKYTFQTGFPLRDSVPTGAQAQESHEH